MKLRQILNNSKISFHEKMNLIKTNLTPNEFNKVFNNNALLKNFLVKDLFIRKIENIKINEAYSFTNNFETEFQWIANKILLNSEKIKEFISQYNEFNNNFLLSNFEDSETILNDIKQKFGYSLWQIEAELHLKENKFSSSENWKLLSHYLSIVNNPIYEFCINASSKRIETNLSFESYLNQFQNDLGNMRIFDFLNDFFVFNSFKIASFTYNFPNLIGALYVSNILGIIDQYLLLVDIIIYNISANNRQYFNIFLKFSEKLLAAGFEDKRLINIINVISAENQMLASRNNIEIFTAFEHYYKGDYVKSKNQSFSLILKFPDNFELYEIYIKSLINSNSKFEPLNNLLIDDILVNLYDFLSFTKLSDKSGKNLMKFANKYVNLHLGYQLIGFLREIENTLDNDISFYFSTSHNSFKLLQSSHFGFELGKKYEIFKDFNFASYKQSFFGINTKSSNEYYSTSDPRQKITVDLVSSYHNEDYAHCINIVKNNNLLNENSNYYRERFVFYFYHSLINDKKLIDALQLFDVIFFDENILFYKIKHNSLYSLVCDEQDKFAFLDDINALVLSSLFNSSYDLYEFLDEYLSIHNLNFDSLDEILEKMRLDQGVYLLSKIYTVETLKYYFRNVSEVEEFRIKILEKLITLDSSNKNIYTEEITAIGRNLSVRNVIKEVNNARLFVDIAKLKEILINNYTDDFTRLLLIVAEKKNNNLVSFNPSRKRDWEKSFKESSESQQNTFDDADFIAFKNIYYYIRDQFLFSKEYGLDSCLSTRIRHGALKNEIRSVFDSLNLTTTKYGDEYRDNLFWQNQINNIDLNSNIQGILKEFTHDIDNLNDFVVNEVIQIFNELHNQKPNGVFNYSTNDEILYKFYSNHFAYLRTTEDTIDLLLNDLAIFTNLSICTNIFKYFNEVLFEDYKKIIQGTIDKLAQLNIPYNIMIIDFLNKAITNLQTCFDEILEWFYLETSSSSDLLLIESIINASFVMTKRLYKNIKINENINLNFRDVAGYSSLIYVFNILLSNAIVHSNQNDEVKITVNVDLIEEKYIKISVINNFVDIDSSVAKAKLSRIKGNWTNHEDIDRSNIEGQSGFDKIKRIMIYEAKCITEKFDYHIRDGEVEICIFLNYRKPEKNESINN